MNETFRIIKAAPRQSERLCRLFMPEDDMQSLKRRKDNLKTGQEVMLVAEYDGLPVGLIIITLKNDNIPLLVYPNRRCYFYGFNVLPNYRGQGIGKKLLIGAIDFAVGLGYYEQTILSDPNNEVAIALYKKIGFKLIAHNQEISDGKTKYFCDYFLRS